MSIATAAAAQASTAASGNTASATAATAGKSLAGNFDTFLSLLTTQLKNQDPTTPLDTNQFTSQLVQFASVEQQINANANLGTLIDLSRATNLFQASGMVGHLVAATSDQIPLQSGSGAIRLNLTSPQKLNIEIADPSGVVLQRSQLDAAAGSTDWNWNGQTATGHQLPDGAYNVSVTNASGAKVPFTILGTATAVDSTGTSPSVAIGPVNVPMSAVRGIVK